MSYCRFSEGDVYMFLSSEGFTCCSCRMAALVNTIFTKGGKLFGSTVNACPDCKGKGCTRCMMHGDTVLPNGTAALKHLEDHWNAGHSVPERAFERLREEIAEKFL